MVRLNLHSGHLYWHCLGQQHRKQCASMCASSLARYMYTCRDQAHACTCRCMASQASSRTLNTHLKGTRVGSHEGCLVDFAVNFVYEDRFTDL